MKNMIRLKWAILALAVLSTQVTLRAADLQNRYGFTNDASDSVSGQNGILANDDSSDNNGPPTATGGVVNLDGIGQYVSLPGNLITNLSALTFEIWLTPQAEQAWARMWDFGDQYTNTDGSTGSSEEFYSSVAYAGNGPAAQMNGNAGNVVLGGGVLPLSVESHVVWTSDLAAKKARWYINGVLAGSNDTFSNAPTQLGAMPFSYLGQSLFSADPHYDGSIDEFRIWNGALNQLQVAASDQSGPDVLNTNYGTITNIVLQLTTNMTVGGSQKAVVIAGADGLTNNAIDIHDQLGVTYQSGNSSILTVNSNGQVTAVGPGSATIIASYQSLSSTQMVISVEPVAILTHRYSFTTDASDSVGNADGTLVGDAAVSNGQVNFDGLTTTYVQLPTGVITNDPAVTIEAWATFGVQSVWANLYDFGVQDSSGDGAYDIHLGIHDNTAATISGISDSDNANINAQNISLGANSALDNQTNVQIVVVYNSPVAYEAIYINGVLRGVNNNISNPLSGVQDVRNVIGADNWPDPGMTGSVDEFRIYNGALTSQQIAVSDISGPNNTNDDPGALQSLSLVLPTNLTVESAIIPSVLANYANLTNFNLAANTPVPLTGLIISSSNPSVIDYNAVDGRLHSTLHPGTAVITASYQGKTGSQSITITRPPPAILENRYSFTTDASDSVSHADGTLEGNVTIVNGEAVLDGNSGDYVNLPGGLVSGYQAATIEFWANIGNTGGWTYGFAFGNTVNGAGQDYVHFIVKTGYGTHQVDEYTTAGGTGFDMPGALANEAVHVDVVLDPTNGVLGVYTNGVLDTVSYNNNAPLDTIATNFCYIGHSLWTLDPYTTANYDEFRIYNGRLFSDDIAASDAAGPNSVVVSAGSLTVSAANGTITISWPSSDVGFNLYSSPTLGAGAVWTQVSGTPTVSGSSFQLTVPASGSARYFRLQH